MKRQKLATFVRTSVLASSLLLLPITTTLAQTAPPTPETRQMETRDNRDNTGLWGLLGLVGLLGLAGRRREHVRTYTDTHERSKV